MLRLGSPGKWKWKWKWTPACPIERWLLEEEWVFFARPKLKDNRYSSEQKIPPLLVWWDSKKKKRWCCCWSASSFLLEWMTESSLLIYVFKPKIFMMFFFNRSTIPSYVQSIEIEKDIIIHCPVWFANRFLKFLAVAAYVGFFSVSCCVLFYLKRRFWLRRKN